MAVPLLPKAGSEAVTDAPQQEDASNTSIVDQRTTHGITGKIGAHDNMGVMPSDSIMPVAAVTAAETKRILEAMKQAISTVRAGHGLMSGRFPLFKNPFIEDADKKATTLEGIKESYQTSSVSDDSLKKFITEMARPRKTYRHIGEAKPAETKGYQAFVSFLMDTDGGVGKELSYLKAVIMRLDPNYSVEGQDSKALTGKLKELAVGFVNESTTQSTTRPSGGMQS